MTDRLKALLHTEVETLEVPPVPATEILGAGRRLRRRRTGSIWGSAALVVAVVAGGALVARTHDDGQTPLPTTPPPPVQVAWALDDTVYVGVDGHPVLMPEVAQTMYYTSAGVLVRTNKDGASDGGAPFHFQLIKTNGTVSPVDVTLGEVVPSTDPTQPYLAWATQTAGRIQVVVHDVTTDQDVATVDVPGSFTWGGWAAPPVALSGDLVYVGTDDQTAVVNWHTDEATTTEVIKADQLPEVSGGRTVTVSGGAKKPMANVVEVATGRDLLDIPISLGEQVTLSPDGRYAAADVISPGHPIQVYDVATGASTTILGPPGGIGWTSDGSFFHVEDKRLSLCSPTTGACHRTPVPDVGDGFVRYSGLAYES